MDPTKDTVIRDKMYQFFFSTQTILLKFLKKMEKRNENMVFFCVYNENIKFLKRIVQDNLKEAFHWKWI